jgi:Uma2 family endonuclease
MSTANVPRRYSPQEYLALERAAEFKSEYHDGLIYAMSGASREHNLVSINLGRELSSQLKGRPCETYASEMRVFIPSTRRYYYPDISVACDEPSFQDGQFDTLLNPTVVIEILSGSTESFDRGRKFENYREIASLREYVLVSQDRVLVERYTRTEAGWVLSDANRLDDLLRLDSIGCTIPLREIYDRVKVAEGPEPGASSAGDLS